jgi:phospholipid transport system transporter-binding protein
MSGETSRFATGATLTHASASSALAAGLARIEAGAAVVDCAQLTQFDSSALAVLLAWRRAGEARGTALRIVNVPDSLASLAQVYGIDVLFAAQHDAAPVAAAEPLNR